MAASFICASLKYISIYINVYVLWVKRITSCTSNCQWFLSERDLCWTDI